MTTMASPCSRWVSKGCIARLETLINSEFERMEYTKHQTTKHNTQKGAHQGEGSQEAET